MPGAPAIGRRGRGAHTLEGSMRRQWIGAALTVAALLLVAACARGVTAPEAVREPAAAPRWNAVPQDPVQPTSGGYFGSGLRGDDPPKDTTGAT